MDIFIAIYLNGKIEFSFEIEYYFLYFFSKEKIPHDCHFTIQCSRRLSDGSCQLPIVVLHVNIPPSIDPNVPTLLTLGKKRRNKYANIFFIVYLKDWWKIYFMNLVMLCIQH